MDVLATVIAAGGGGGSGIVPKLSTAGGVVYLIITCGRFCQILVVWCKKGRKAAEQEAEEILSDEYKL